jgi:hypothetical protein
VEAVHRHGDGQRAGLVVSAAASAVASVDLPAAGGPVNPTMSRPGPFLEQRADGVRAAGSACGRINAARRRRWRRPPRSRRAASTPKPSRGLPRAVDRRWRMAASHAPRSWTRNCSYFATSGCGRIRNSSAARPATDDLGHLAGDTMRPDATG